MPRRRAHDHVERRLRRLRRLPRRPAQRARPAARETGPATRTSTSSGPGSPARAASPVYDRTSHTCSNVYCHAPRTAGGHDATLRAGTSRRRGSPAAPATPAPARIHGGGPTIDECTLCHPTTVDASGAIVPRGTHANGAVTHDAHSDPAWATETTPHVTPHGLAAEYQDPAYPTGFAGCRACHGSNLDNPIVAGIPSCDSCHTGGAAWKTSCTFCHGVWGGSLATDAAPPRDLHGNASSAKVGAHQVHLFGDGANTPRISNGVACDSCHTVPTGSLHANGTTVVTLKRPTDTVATGTYDSASGTCTASYCHGQLAHNGKPNNTVSWSTTSLSGCDACHAPQYWTSNTVANETEGHQVHNTGCAGCHSSSTSRMNCLQCHPGYSRVGAGTVNATSHVNGTVEVSGSGGNTTVTWDGVNRTCTTTCHDISEHRSAGAPSGSASW